VRIEGFLSAVFFFVLGCRFVSEWKEEVSCIQGLEKTRREIFSFSLLNDSCKYWLFDSLYRQFWNLNRESFLQVFLLVVLNFHVSATIWCVALCFCEIE
jgi:hypothetical protein